MAEALRQEPGVEVEVVNGNRGEFTVRVDGRVVAQKGPIDLPTVEEVVKAVRQAKPAPASP